ncbi:dihydroneopterin aldolase [Helicobacter sp. 11S02629-2]|uniref:dihydroneopterin aldolase n=1 Tax=Helicobacter sp. 11S02629-2 TaxID=1476195 RepID=UPI000BA673AF|nr:dihydroneopterin aldolase [Helicobacter sp. 11S02629-2]PAF46003.1 hypothetical protein BKH40_00915 [Helicobacter sp. 11S02629-2]
MVFTLVIDSKLKAVIGILDSEAKPQALKLKAKIKYEYENTNKAYLNYASILRCIESRLEEGGYGLLEDALLDISRLLFIKYPSIKSLDLSLIKLEIIEGAKVGARLKIKNSELF